MGAVHEVMDSTHFWRRFRGSGQRSLPCVLVGHSFSGLIAFEAAHQLNQQGGKVEMVIIRCTS
jgi:thioesterase domain-containing protein